MREPQDLHQRDRGFRRLWRAGRCDPSEARDRVIDAAESLLDHAAEEIRLRIVGRELERRVEIGVGLDEPATVEVCAASSEPGREVAARLREHGIGGADRAVEIALVQQPLEVGGSGGAVRHGERIRAAAGRVVK